MISSTQATMPESERAQARNKVMQTPEPFNNPLPDVEVQMINLSPVPPVPARLNQYAVLQVPNNELIRSRRLIQLIKFLLLLVLLFVAFGLIASLISLR